MRNNDGTKRKLFTNRDSFRPEVIKTVGARQVDNDRTYMRLHVIYENKQSSVQTWPIIVSSKHNLVTVRCPISQYKLLGNIEPNKQSGTGIVVLPDWILLNLII